MAAQNPTRSPADAMTQKSKQNIGMLGKKKWHRFSFRHALTFNVEHQHKLSKSHQAIVERLKKTRQCSNSLFYKA